jgi:hypothetical protein
MSNLSTKFYRDASYFVPAGSVPFRSAPIDHH